ncbi:imidazole glycerol phosphate synthase subunit HisH [Aliarcobacter cryaerophilus]|uniref:imidazole glycerol phosphate synthase subunit HisH n=1 Tax=Aliarcobacter cryaerophilus TaxID=28198 RepID=UPI0021B5C2BD|nr:imidazole glycerol phosphate synthase subunit HisH [Aliarcobacter cryaerophilus]MCT7405749.1 imidazole glycerol phosphate synthase subunit HisH [Aliarcobacter cryaerophilus]MCT7503308.1 imidazole glycerol phosphate synthase subunit HisH [Aliarcobacter cryaerophilus]
MIAILDYGVGNLKSIYNMFKKVGVESFITSNIEDIKNANKYLLPGVGSFDHGITSLKKTLFFETLEKEVLENKKPILGICLGMQLLTNSSEEGKEKGLGWIDAQTMKFDLEDKNLSIPHMGWNKTIPINTNTIFRNLDENRFYFVHSYHVVCNSKENILATSNYGEIFTCSIYKENIYGVQFHPEKSHKFGMQLLKNFGDL